MGPATDPSAQNRSQYRSNIRGPTNNKSRHLQTKLGRFLRSSPAQPTNPYFRRPHRSEKNVRQSRGDRNVNEHHHGRRSWGLMGGANGPTMKQIGEYLYSRSDNVESSDNSIVEGCGDDPSSSAGGENPFRIYFQNICGLKLQKSKHTLVDIVGFLSSFGVALVGLAETNTNWKQFESKHIVDTYLRLGFGHARMATSSSGLRSNNLYQAGGTLTAALGKWCGRKMDAGNDEVGCYSWIRLRGRKGRKVTFVTCYRVSQSSGAGLGDATAYVQQETKLRLKNLKADPREYALTSLTELISERRRGGEEIVVMMDANERLTPGKGRLHQFVTETGLVDAIGMRTDSPTRTCLRGSTRIDYIFLSPGLVPAVTKSGQLGIHEAIASDHSAVWVEFDGNALFRGQTDNLGSTLDAPFTAREIHKMDRYNAKVDAHLKATNVEARLERLNEGVSGNDFVREFEKISNDVDDAMRAGINCVRRRNVGYARSPALTRAASIVRYWRTQLRAARNSIPLSKAAVKFAKSVGLPSSIQPKEEVFRQLHDAWASMRTIQKQATEMREEWLAELVESAASEMNTSKEAALKQILEENRLRKLYRRLKPLGKGIPTGALARVKIPKYQWFYSSTLNMLFHYCRGAFFAHARLPGIDNEEMPFSKHRTRMPLPKKNIKVATVKDDGNVLIMTMAREEKHIWEDVTESDRIEDLLLERNAEHLRQCTIDETPFAVPPLDKLFGKYGVNENADAILDGDFNVEALPLTDEAKVWLKTLRYDGPKKDEIEVSISPEQFHTMARKCNPRTASSPSGFGYVVWKANSRSELGCRIHSRMMSIPFEKGFAPTRWKRCLEIMLEKEAGNPLIHRLRIIVLLEADFNMALRLIWMHRLFNRAEEANFVDEQWGNRKKKNAHDCLTMKLLTCESCRIMRSKAALMAMDAAACYDRILTYMANISERKYGLPKSACVTKGSAIFEMQRHVRTAYGESRGSYSSTPNDLLHGECQGKTSSPPSWAILTISLLKALKHFNKGITITDVENQNSVTRVADMFVDDCDLWTTVGADESESKLEADFTTAAQAWERLLFASGGLLALQKCYWWLIAWDWKNSLPICRDPSNDQHRVELQSGNDDSFITIQRLPMTEANVGLGFRLAPSGSQEQEVAHRKTISDCMAAKVNSTNLTATEAWVFYRSIYHPSMFYPARLTSFTRKEWSEATRKFTHAIIRPMGFNGHTARRIIYGPRSLGGVGLVPGWAVQGADSTTHFLAHVRGGTKVGQLMLNTLSQLQLLSGQLRGLLENPQPLPSQRPRKSNNLLHWHHLGRGWLLSLRHFLHTIKGTIQVEKAWTPRLTRENDESIMDAIKERCKPSEFQLAMANAVRVYLRVVMLSDITNNAGSHIEGWARSGILPRTSVLQWPRQAKPTAVAVRIWRRYLTIAFGLGATNPRTGPMMLRRPLGRWLERSHIAYNHYWDSKSLYTRQDDGTFKIHHPYRLSKRIYPYASRAACLPRNASPTQATLRRWGITVPAGPRGLIESPSIKWSEGGYLEQCPSQEARILAKLPTPAENARAVKDLSDGLMVAATDGSYDPHRRQAACSWVLYSRRDKSTIKGGCPVDGDHTTLDSFRAELEGIRAVTYYLRFLRRTKKDFTAPLRLAIWIDNEQALRRGTEWGNDTPAPDKLMNESDIIEDIRRACHEADIHWNGHHVKSHQEDLQNAPLEVRLNEECDRLAKQCLHEARPSSMNTAARPPGDMATLRIGDNMITNNIRTRLQNEAMMPDMKEYLVERNNWDDETMGLIDWEHYEIAVTRVFKASKTRFGRLIKMAHNIQNTGRQKKLFAANSNGPEASDLCPCCMLHEETTMHIYQCRSPEVRKLLQRGLDDFEDKLRLRHMPSAMWTAIREGVTAYCNAATTPPEVAEGRFTDAYNSQSRIGWGHFLKGRVSTEWGKLMGNIYTSTPSYRIHESRRRFVTTMILCLWDLYDTLWRHRCERLHDNTDINALSKVDIDRRIRFYYKHKNRIFDSGDYDRFHMGLQNTLSLPMTQKKAWIETLAHRQIATDRARKRLINRIRPLTAYFDSVEKNEDMDE